MEIIGYLMAVLIGLVLGLLGGGGSTLTVPVLVYLLGIDVVLATGYSLFVVGAAALFGAINNYFKGLVDLKTAFIFGIPSIFAVFITRQFIIPAIPDSLFMIGEREVTKSLLMMVLFALLMIGASISMIRGRKEVSEDKKDRSYFLIIIDGAVVGLLTGLVGAGGGFLIIPALALMMGLPMKKAVATSLLIIAMKSLIGFLGDVSNYVIDWPFLLSFAGLAVVGIFIGGKLSNIIPGPKLKPIFGWFILAMGIWILGKELLTN